MSKTLSQTDKQSLIVILFISGFVIMMAINIFIIVPKLTVIYKPVIDSSGNGSIDVRVVNQAMQLIEGKNN